MPAFYQEGRYKGEIIEQGFGEASTGTVQFVLNVKIFETESGDPVQENTRFVFKSITEKTMPYLLEDLRALGFNGTSLSQLDPDRADHHSLVGQTHLFFCKHEYDQQGNQRERWNLYRGGNSLDLKPPDSKKLRDLDMLFGRAAKQKPATTKQPPPPPPSWSSDPTDDQVPF